MTDPEPDPQPQPVVSFATQLGKLVAAAFVAVGFVWFLIAGGITGENLGAVGQAIGGAVTAVVGLGAFVWAHLGGKNAAEQVTPVSSPRSAKNEELHTAAEWTARSRVDLDAFAERLNAGFDRWREQLPHPDDTQELPVAPFEHPNLKLGKRPTDPARPVLRMGAHFTAAAFTAPASVDYASRVKAWLLGRNNEFGTCGPTAVANLALLASTLLADAPVAFTDDEIIDLYRRSGNPDFDPATGGGDRGVDMTVMLAELVRGGIGFGDRNVKAVAFGSIDPHDTGKLWAAAALFGGVLWGSDLDQAQADQFDNGRPWDYVRRSPAWGGHATLAAPKYADEAGTLADRTTTITWATAEDCTDAFITNQVAECYVVLFPWHLGQKRIYEALDMAGVAAEYEALTGRQFPAPITPPAPPAPPAPVPAPSSSGPSADDVAWARKVLGEHWRSRQDKKIAADILAMAGQDS